MNRLIRLLGSLMICSAAALIAGCDADPAPPPGATGYVDQGYKPGIAPYMRGTIFERTDLGNIQPYPVSGYSLVANLQGTGDSSGIPTTVRAAIEKRMNFAGFGRIDDPYLVNLKPEQVLSDKRVAVVEVIGLLPVGSRRGDRFDVVVRAMPRTRTTSLAHGELYKTELRNRGLELPNGGGPVYAYVDGGDVFVNPVYALNGPDQKYPGADGADVVASLRKGEVLNGALATEDRAIYMQLRVPQSSIARTIERRINTRLPAPEGDRAAAAAQDEGLIYLYVPYSYQGDWEHFIGLVNHLYVNDAPDYLVRKAKELMAAAHDAKSDLNDISYCLEGLGPSAVPIYQPMLSDPDPAVVFAAARAGVFCGDDASLGALVSIALMDGHPYQLAAVKALGQLPKSELVDKQMEPLLGSAQTTVRVEAYQILAAHGDRRIITQDLPNGFKLDIVDYPGTPLVYAVRSGVPRLAIFNPATTLAPPVMFTAMGDRLTISTDELGQAATLFYRDPRSPEPVKTTSGLMLQEVVARLGEMGPEDQTPFEISYSVLVSILQGLSGEHVIGGPGLDGKAMTAPFVLEEPTEVTDAMVAAALSQRPQADPLKARPSADAAQGSTTGTPTADSSVPSFGGTAPATGNTGVTPAAPLNAPPAPTGNNGAAGSPSVPSFGNP